MRSPSSPFNTAIIIIIIIKRSGRFDRLSPNRLINFLFSSKVKFGALGLKRNSDFYFVSGILKYNNLSSLLQIAYLSDNKHF